MYSGEWCEQTTFGTGAEIKNKMELETQLEDAMYKRFSCHMQRTLGLPFQGYSAHFGTSQVNSSIGKWNPALCGKQYRDSLFHLLGYMLRKQKQKSSLIQFKMVPFKINNFLSSKF